MKIDPIEEWRRLTEHYREMSDEELYELEADFAGLTETAQQVLRDVMRTRGLDKQRRASVEADEKARAQARQQNFALNTAQAAEDAWGAGEEVEEDAQPSEFTWKTVLCDCEDREEALLLHMTLRRARIESWVDGPASGLSGSQVAVAADQLEQAEEIAAQPIPQEIIDEFNKGREEYQPPVCPKCGTEDPVLESVDPVNSWLCESCGEQWSDSVPSEAS
jgi:hypothetical protein